MKYNEKNPPQVCMQTQSSCYKGTGKMQIKGILWHDTGANNPNLKRYVQPSDDASDKEVWLKKLGKNPYNNDWNHAVRKAGMNCWIGKLADGTVTTVQTMPWDYRPWGCGSGKKGSCNNGWIQFEICEDSKADRDYFNKIYAEACELTAYLCKTFCIDPFGTANCSGITVPTILCHQDSYKLGLGSNHSDIYDWFKRYGKDMDTVRQDVAQLLADEDKPDVPLEESQQVRDKAPDQPQEQPNERTIWNAIHAFIGNNYGTAALMGNLYAESKLKSNNLQNTGNQALGWTDEQYTASVDNRSYADFVNDRFGFGLAQWTYPSRKEALLSFARQQGVSIGDWKMQIQFIQQELGEKLLSTLKTASSVQAASNAVLFEYERPADQSLEAQNRRAAYGQRFYERYYVPAYFRVRTSWSDKASQKGAFLVFQYAKDCADANPGYAVFNESGTQVYPVAEQSDIPCRVRITRSDIPIYIGPGIQYPLNGRNTGKGVFTIVEKALGSGSAQGWGLLKAYADQKNGWINLDTIV